MAFKLVCVHEFHDHHTGEVIKRGQEIHDYEHIAKLYHGNRMHHFQRVHLFMAESQWEWPPQQTAKKEKM